MTERVTGTVKWVSGECVAQLKRRARERPDRTSGPGCCYRDVCPHKRN